jgi:hypothetical protein
MKQGDSKTLDMVKFARDLQSQIIIAIICGYGQHAVKLPCQTENGLEEVTLPDMMNKSLKDLMERALKNPLVMMVPALNDKGITAAERRFIANARTLRTHIEGLIKERKQKASQTGN